MKPIRMAATRWLPVCVIAGIGFGCQSRPAPARDAGAVGESADARPNVVFILLDDAGFGDFGAYGSPTIRTPNLDALAARGLRFSQFYASGPVCSPSRAAFLSGRYPAEFGLRRSVDDRSYRGLPGSVFTLAEYLRAEGYRTAHIGKWHLGERRAESRPAAQGFEHVVTPSGSGYFDPLLRIDGGRPEVHAGHLTEILTDSACEFLTEHRDARFLLNLWYRAPHTPLDAPAAWAGRYPKRAEGRYAALLSHTDEQIGRVLARLDELGLAEETLVVLASDNGPARSSRTTSGPLRGYKGDVFEGGIRVPMVIRWPGRIAPRSETEAVVASMDLFPTVVSLLGDEPGAYDLAGQSFAALLDGDADWTRRGTLHWEIKPSHRGSYLDRAGTYLNDFAVREDDWKLVFVDGTRSLFDLRADPVEAHDLAAANPEIVRDLEKAHARWRIETTRIPYAVDDQNGAVEVLADGTFRFDGPAEVTLANDVRWDIDDGDFTVRFVLHTFTPGVRQILMRKLGSWEIMASDQSRLTVVVTAPGGTETVLATRAALSPDRSHRIALSIFGLKRGASLTRLFLDGSLEAESQSVERVPMTANPITLGTIEGTGAERVTLSGLEFYSASLVEAELELGRDSRPGF